MSTENNTPENVKELKKIQRKLGLYGRNQLDPEEKKLNDNMITLQMMYDPDFLNAKIILSYMPIESEVDVTIINNTALMLEKKVAYPVCLEDGSMIAVVPGPEDGIEKGAFNIPTPVVEKGETIAPENIDLVIVPCAAFDPECKRIGRGGGYYDRFLPKCTNASTIMVAYERQKIDKVIIEDTDYVTNKALTEQGWYPKN